MIRTTHQFALGDLCIDGSVELTPAGLDIVRAVIMRGISTAKKGEDKARQMLHIEGGDLFRKSLNYYRNAGAFLRHMLATMKGFKHQVRDELYALRSVPEGEPYPAEWREYLQLAADLECADEPAIPVGKGCRAGHRSEPVEPAPPHGRGGEPADGTADGQGATRRQRRGRKKAG